MFRMFEKHEREIENEDYLIRAYALHLRMKNRYNTWWSFLQMENWSI